MKRTLMLAAALALVFAVGAHADTNPFYAEWGTPHETPDFSRITVEHYMPAFEKGIEQQREEVENIANNPDLPTFANTIEAIEASGKLVTDVSNVFFNLSAANTNDDIKEIAKEIAPRLTKLQDDVMLNEKLFARVKSLYDERDKLGLSAEQTRLLEEYYKDFVRGGANLEDEAKGEFREINERLSVLSLKFGENVLEENNKFELVIESDANLAGLPPAVVTGAAEAATERGHEGKWVFTLHKPSMLPFLTYSKKRDLREKIFKGYIERGNHNDDLDNKAILTEMASLRAKRAKLLGYETHAHFVLDRNMAGDPDAVYNLLNKLWDPALARAKGEAKDLQKMIDEEGGGFKLEAWDWWYFAERVKKAKFDFDDEQLRPYFEVEAVRKGAFEVARRLFGITFHKRDDISKYHEDVEVFEVKDADGSHIGIYYVDYYPRASKRGGAWMNAYRPQSRLGGKEVAPIICNVSNVSKPTADKPALLSVDEVNTLFHEFGHALHGLLSDVTYSRLSGTSVARDFVEMPSQVFENWAMEPEVLALYARHYKTGELIPDELIEKMNNAKLFNQGFATTEYLAASFLDLDWHTLLEPTAPDPTEFENKSLSRIGLIPEIVVRYRSPYFRHIFAGGYSSGYYSYIWAEVFDADAFEAFKEEGLLNRDTGMRFRNEILAKGGTEDAKVLFKRFRGSDPKIDPLLKRRGLN
jgi:peptidyl-dipeptidase Dcp